MAQTYFATINPGLEDALLQEVRELGGKRAKATSGGVEFSAATTTFYRAALRLRTTNRLWMRIDEFRARDAPELFNKTARFDWSRLIPADVPVEVRGVSRASRLIHTDRISRAVQDGIAESLGAGERNGAPLRVLARLVDNRCELSLDASGDLHYRRGYKTEAVAAPLRESIAGAVLRIVGWEPGQTLLDPFCGSGTIPIEAAQRARGEVAGALRSFDLQRWANFRQETWDEVLAEELTRVPTQFFASDIDETAVEAARHNAAQAGVSDTCFFAVADAADIEPPEATPGWIVTNPPWNLRLEDPDLDALKSLTTSFRKKFDGWGLAVISPRRWTLPHGQLAAKFELGGTPVSLWVIPPK